MAVIGIHKYILCSHTNKLGINSFKPDLFRNLAILNNIHFFSYESELHSAVYCSPFTDKNRLVAEKLFTNVRLEYRFAQKFSQ